MPSSILITGGCRSGKSSRALEIARRSQKTPCLFIATCVPDDDEMRKRVQLHQQERPAQWQTLEVPIELTHTILKHGRDTGIMVIDCVTLWISNLMTQFPEDDQIMARVQELGQVLTRPPCSVILVSNEVGCGVVPAHPLSRRFRDLAGWSNQCLAERCHQVIWMVSGIPVPIKPAPAVNGTNPPAD